MQATSIAAIEPRRRRKATPTPAVRPTVAADRAIAPAPAPNPQTRAIGAVSRAGGTWTVDWERARVDAQQVLDAIDFSKRDIVIWVPGTDTRGVHPQFEAALRDSYRGDGSNLVSLQYEASWHLRRSVPTGVATLKLVLEGIRARGGDHRVLVAGESQGAWIAGEAAADPDTGQVVDRAILLGHPWLARHQYADGQDPRIRVINHVGDQVAMAVKGDAQTALDAMVAIRTLRLDGFDEVVRALAANPRHGVQLLGSIAFAIPGLKALLRNPHDYSSDMSRAVEYLRHGSLPLSAAMRRLLHLKADPLLTDPGHDEQQHLRLQRSAALLAYAAART